MEIAHVEIPTSNSLKRILQQEKLKAILISSLGLGCLASGDSGGSVEGARPRLPDCTVYLDRISLRLHRQQATH